MFSQSGTMSIIFSLLIVKIEHIGAPLNFTNALVDKLTLNHNRRNGPTDWLTHWGTKILRYFQKCWRLKDLHIYSFRCVTDGKNSKIPKFISPRKEKNLKNQITRKRFTGSGRNFNIIICLNELKICLACATIFKTFFMPILKETTCLKFFYCFSPTIMKNFGFLTIPRKMD